MKSNLKKLMALVIAGIMVLSMSVAAFAAVGDDTNGAETGVQESKATSVTINTAVVVTNNETTAAEGKTIAYPAMSFVYEVAPATVAAGTTVTDATEEDPQHPTGPAVTVEVKAGPVGGITKSGGTIVAGTVTLNAKGQEAVFVPTTFTGDITKFEAAGVYRYKITDASTTDATNLAALQNAGVVKGESTDTEYFLDVYVKNGTNGLEFGGFVLMNSNPGADGTESISKKDNKNMDVKESGFDEVDVITTTDPDDPTKTETKLDPTKTADLTKNYSYTTYNVTLQKKVAGGLGDKKHGFPFAVAVGVQDGHPSLGYGYEVTGSDNASLNHTYNALEAVPADQKMSNGSTLKIWGLSPFATVNYTETNDTDSKYDVTVGTAADGKDLKDEKAVAKNSTVAAWTEPQNVATGYAIGTTATLSQAADAVYFTNTLNEISPTGVALRFAPYLLMMGAAALLVVLFVRRRRTED